MLSQFLYSSYLTNFEMFTLQGKTKQKTLEMNKINEDNENDYIL